MTKVAIVGGAVVLGLAIMLAAIGFTPIVAPLVTVAVLVLLVAGGNWLNNAFDFPVRGASSRPVTDPVDDARPGESRVPADHGPVPGPEEGSAPDNDAPSAPDNENDNADLSRTRNAGPTGSAEGGEETAGSGPTPGRR